MGYSFIQLQWTYKHWSFGNEFALPSMPLKYFHAVSKRHHLYQIQDESTFFLFYCHKTSSVYISPSIALYLMSLLLTRISIDWEAFIVKYVPALPPSTQNVNYCIQMFGCDSNPGFVISTFDDGY